MGESETAPLGQGTFYMYLVLFFCVIYSCYGLAHFVSMISNVGV